MTAGPAALGALADPERYRALPVQFGMVVNNLRYPGDGVDVLQITLDWAEPLHRPALDRAWQDVVSANPVLRTGFEADEVHGLVQVVGPSAVDIRWREQAVDFEQFLRADRRERFDPSRPPLIRLTVLGSHRAVLTFHHALLDGRSMRLLVEQLTRCYAARLVGRAPTQPTRPPFRDFVQWWQLADTEAAQAFWTDQLVDPVLPRSLPGLLPLDRLGAQASAAEPCSAELALTAAESDRVRQAGERLGLNASTLVTAAWALLRARYGGVDDVVLAVTRSCRPASIPDADQVIGLLINTVPLRIRIDPAWTVEQLLNAVNHGIRQLREYQLSPMASILGWAGLPVDSPLIDSLVMFDRHRLQTGLAEGLSDDAHAAVPVSVRVDRLPSYPLTVLGYDEPELLLGAIWDGRRFAAGAPQLILEQVRATLLAFADCPDAALADLRLSAEFEPELIASWNRTGAELADATIGELFAEQVRRQPTALAVQGPDGRCSYAELDRRSDRLARALRRLGMRTGDPVAVALPRGLDLIVALLGVLKAGGAYLPIDPASPSARLAGMLAGTRLMLAEDVAAAPDVPGVEVLTLTELADSDDPLPVAAHPLSLAYLSYTSGSTGQPKGVAVPHRAVVRLISDPTFVRLGPGERVLQLAPVAFDASTLEIWGALLTGATLVIAPPGPLGLPELAALLRTERISVAWLTAGLFHQLVESDVQALAGVGQLLAGGDVLDPVAVRAALAARAGKPLVNGYGPTENTTFTTCYSLTAPDQVGTAVPIGAPIQHTFVQVLDGELRPVPIGVAGELYTGGAGLAQGYRGDPAATARTFVPDPTGAGGRLYRTGDLVRWRADGVLEFVGRVDDQVKIRGFRVEPGEVEAALRSYPGVVAAAVLVRGEGADRHLIGYVAADQPVRPDQLREFLSYRLPDYLVPAGFAVLEKFPLNANGKLDRSGLGEPDPESRQPASPPRGETELRLAGIWQQLLPGQAAGPGREDSFFALGGNSLSAARLMFRIRELFDVELPLAAFYSDATLAACAAAIEAGRAAAAAPKPMIGRRSRADYRVDKPALAGHLVRLTDDWALWRNLCLRAAGFEVGLLAALGDPVLAGLADAAVSDRAEAAYRAEFPAAVGRLSAALHRAAGLPALREAVAWQNRHGLSTGIDPLLRGGPAPVGRNTKHRQHEALLASYLQRYCAKNDTIGFYGPVSWSTLADGPSLQVRHSAEAAGSMVSARTCYLEGWAVRAVLAEHQAALRPWLVPRRMPFLDVQLSEHRARDERGAERSGDQLSEHRARDERGAERSGDQDDRLLVPLAPPLPLRPAEAAVLSACDGLRDARAVAAQVLDLDAGFADETEVFAVLAQLSDSHRLAWQVDLAPQDIRPERSMAAVLQRVDDPAVRAPAEAALAELTGARDALAEAAGDPDQVAARMAALETTFTGLTGQPPTRRAGALYAGRTLAFEECLRTDPVRVGTGSLDGVRDALGLVLDAARWFTAECGARYVELFEQVYRQRSAELGSPTVPLADLWLITNDSLFTMPPELIRPAIQALQDRWSAIFGLPTDQRQIRLGTQQIKQAVAEAFPYRPRVWPMAVHHSPDLMVADAAADDGRPLWVLGEVHPSIVTTRYASWLAFHPDPAGMRAALRQDLGTRTVFLAETAEDGGVAARLSNVLTSPGDLRLVFAHDSSGYHPDDTLVVGQCEVFQAPTGLRVRRRDGSLELGLLEVLGDLLTAVLAQSFHLVSPAAHGPRIQIDDLVVSRESWTLPGSEPPFADEKDEATRYLQARAWAGRHGFPRHVFLRFTGERKPIYADLTSLASIDLSARGLRRSRRVAGEASTVTVVEMLPNPEQAWLADADGRRYTAELRMVAVDQKMRG